MGNTENDNNTDSTKESIRIRTEFHKDEATIIPLSVDTNKKGKTFNSIITVPDIDSNPKNTNEPTIVIPELMPKNIEVMTENGNDAKPSEEPAYILNPLFTPIIEDDENSTTDSSDNNGNKNQHNHKYLNRIAIILCILTGLYLTAVYSNIPFIAKWRTIYIETAMTTNSHQWLATWLIPGSVIDKVTAEQNKSFENQDGLNSSWAIEDEEDNTGDFYEVYWELDSTSFKKYLEEHPSLTENGMDNILIEDLDNKLRLKTSEGDDILVVNAANNLLIIGVEGSGYRGKLAIAKDPSQVDLVKSSALGSYGQEIDSFCSDNDAILGINASGFKDVDGVGTGGQIKGCLVIDGVDYGSHHEEDGWKYFGFKENDRMYVTNYSYGIEKEYRWAMEFFPALIVNGESVVDGTYGMGIQPRATFGQTENGDVLMLVVDGRQVGYSLGCTVGDCTEVMMRYHAYQGMNLDGGSSAVMYYDGNFITKSSSVTGRGRYMPDAFVVKRTSEESTIKATPAN